MGVPFRKSGFRAVSKIAFNYLAHWQEPEFVLKNDFDVIRQYILNETKVDYPLVKVSNKPILKDEPFINNRMICHIITVNWAADKKSIMAQVSLFNQITYSIYLSRNFSGIWRNIKKGHIFFPNKQAIKELTSSNLLNGIVFS